MRFRSFRRGDQTGLAIVRTTQLIGMMSDEPRFPGELYDLIVAGPAALAEAYSALERGHEIDPTAIRCLPVLPKPPKIVCVGLNYRDHAAESGFVPPPYPTLFARFSTSLIGHEEPLVRPKVSQALDFEGELAVIVGRRGRQITQDEALDYVAGYSIFNDGSIRDYQHKTPQWTVGKNFDGTGAFGPDFVSADELPAGGSGLRIETRLNGETVQSSTTAAMIFDVKSLIAIISEALTLEPGDVIVSGTPSGVGHARSPRLYMKPGDVCEVEIEGLGILRNAVVDEAFAAAA
jgi:2-keto-4-pentenoate hydratase/2-oxohepta-3-ene-1,7-dioic acid hydratase in catechol pathway